MTHSVHVAGGGQFLRVGLSFHRVCTRDQTQGSAWLQAPSLPQSSHILFKAFSLRRARGRSVGSVWTAR